MTKDMLSKSTVLDIINYAALLVITIYTEGGTKILTNVLSALCFLGLLLSLLIVHRFKYRSQLIFIILLAVNANIIFLYMLERPATITRLYFIQYYASGCQSIVRNLKDARYLVFYNLISSSLVGLAAYFERRSIYDNPFDLVMWVLIPISTVIKDLNVRSLSKQWLFMSFQTAKSYEDINSLVDGLQAGIIIY